jgi:hypothetical protein
VVKSDVKKIMSEIAKVKPEFKVYYKTPCYLPEIRKRTVIKPLKNHRALDIGS